MKTGLNERELAAYKEHVAYLDKLTRDGVLILAMRADPFVAHGVVKPKLQPFKIAAGTVLNGERASRPQ